MVDCKYPWFTGDPEQFCFDEKKIAGDLVVLITPKAEKAVGAPWYDYDKKYRSSVWRVSDGKPVSLGYKKFVNFGEQPEFEPVDPDEPAVFVEKIDGTCLICSKYKGKHIFRTRGTMDAFGMHNGYELECLLEKDNKERKAIDSLSDDYSVIFEWVSPENRLCVAYPEFKLFLTGIIRHSDYSYFSQQELDDFAEKFGLNRPGRSTFSLCRDLPEVAKHIFNKWEMREGVVAYIGEDQQVLKKMKSEWQLKMHVARGLIGNTNKLIEWCYDNGVFDSINFDAVTKIFASKMEHEVVEYYKEALCAVWTAWTCVDLRKSVARAVTSKATDPHEIVHMITSGSWTSSPTYLWTEFRHTEYKKSFICSEVKKFMEEHKA